VVDAVAILGLNILRQLVLSLSLVDANQEGACKGFNYQYFWSHSLLRAIAAQQLVLRGSLASPEEIFILGLLGQVGQLALASSYPQEYSTALGKVVLTDEGAEQKLTDLEFTEFGLTHNQLTAELLTEWGIPQLFQKIAMHYKNPGLAGFTKGDRDWRLLNVLHLADLLASFCLVQESRRQAITSKLLRVSSSLEIEVDVLAELGDRVVKEWQEWSKLFGIHSVAVPSLVNLLGSVPQQQDSGKESAHLYESADSCSLRILVVDDDRSILMLLQHLLIKMGHTVVTAKNGLEGLGKVADFKPQLIITDWVMPEMDGIEFCKALRQNPAAKDIYVVIVTAQVSTEQLVEAFEAGADDYINKPLNFKVLGARLRAGQRVVQLQEELEFDRRQLRRFAAELEASNQHLQQLALTDVLTELPNRRNANEQLDREWAIAERTGRPLSCMMIDIDYFKLINDTYGHNAGDDVLKQLANVLRTTVRKQDMVCRLGGEEFLVICPDSPPENAFQYAERLRLSVAASNIHSDAAPNIRITVSIGLAYKHRELLNVDMLMQLADKRLYAAKAGGRNKIVAE
jgi:diguanylate cyclase (GGDEF)-like protein